MVFVPIAKERIVEWTRVAGHSVMVRIDGAEGELYFCLMSRCGVSLQ